MIKEVKTQCLEQTLGTFSHSERVAPKLPRQFCKLESPLILVKKENSFEACFGEEQVGRERSAFGRKPVNEQNFAIASSERHFSSLGLI